MKPRRLAGMIQNAISFDLETALIQPGLLSPPMVLGSAAEIGPTGQLCGFILTKAQAREIFTGILNAPEAVLCGANIAYDLLVLAVDFAQRGVDVMPQIMAMYDPNNEVVRGDCDGRVFEIQLAEGLHAIAQGHLGKHALSGQQFRNDNGRAGRYSLKHVTFEVLGREDAKANDRFRMSYAMFDDKPLEQLPFEARQYPIDDAVNTLEVALAQAGHLPAVWPHDWQPAGVGMTCIQCRAPMTPDAPQACMRKQPRRNLHALSLQAYFAWAAHLGSSWGFRIDQTDVDALEAKVDAAREGSIAPFVAAGIIRDNGTEDQGVLKRLVAVAYGSRDICQICAGSRKVDNITPSGKKSKINCAACDGTGLSLAPEVPRSDGGGVAKARDVLGESGDELLMEYGEQPSKKIKTTYIPLLRKARACNVCGLTGVATKYKKAHEEWCTAPEGEAGYREIPLCPRVDPLKETLRAAIEDGLHGIPRKGGVREAIGVPDDYVLSSEDFTAGELVTLAQACIDTVGYSKLADALNEGIDVHLALAGTICGRSYDVMLAAKKAKEKWLDDLRQVGKKSNFGFGGGMAELEFTLKPCRADRDLFTPCPGGPAERYGQQGFSGCRLCILMDHESYCGRPGDKVLVYNDRPTGSPVCIKCLRAGKRAREAYFRQWPEVKELHNNVKKLIKDVGPSGTPEINYPGLVTRGGLGFCDGGNGYFQMRLAKAAKAAFCQVQRECVDRTIRVHSSEMMTSKYAGAASPLYGSRAIALFHDEIIAAHPRSVASDAAQRISEVMIESLRWSCPKLFKAIKAEPTLMSRLYKGAEPVWKDGKVGGELLVWEPKAA